MANGRLSFVGLPRNVTEDGIARFCDADTLYALNLTCRSGRAFFSKPLHYQDALLLTRHILEGRADDAMSMVAANPRLLITNIRAAGNGFEHAFEAALSVADMTLIHAFLKSLPRYENRLTAESQQIRKILLACEKPYQPALRELIEACRTYISSLAYLTGEQRDQLIHETIGAAEGRLPVNVLQLICDPSVPFIKQNFFATTSSRSLVFKDARDGREKKVRPSSQSGLGVALTIIPRDHGDVVWGEQKAPAKQAVIRFLQALERLELTRREQMLELKEILEDDELGAKKTSALSTRLQRQP